MSSTYIRYQLFDTDYDQLTNYIAVFQGLLTTLTFPWLPVCLSTVEQRLVSRRLGGDAAMVIVAFDSHRCSNWVSRLEEATVRSSRVPCTKYRNVSKQRSERVQQIIAAVADPGLS